MYIFISNLPLVFENTLHADFVKPFVLAEIIKHFRILFDVLPDQIHGFISIHPRVFHLLGVPGRLLVLLVELQIQPNVDVLQSSLTVPGVDEYRARYPREEEIWNTYKIVKMIHCTKIKKKKSFTELFLRMSQSKTIL